VILQQLSVGVGGDSQRAAVRKGNVPIIK
jgi:hypothetical protein